MSTRGWVDYVMVNNKQIIKGVLVEILYVCLFILLLFAINMIFIR
jgi:hypothetical protein